MAQHYTLRMFVPFGYPTLILLLALLAAALIWLDGARVREAAQRIAVEVCRRRSLQLLDGTVALTRLRPVLDRARLRIERTYVFDYAVDGVGRSSGFVIMLGHELQHLGLESGGSG
ncbi:MAG: DUF3301 domain-containing protein [Gammaproteobacteria bacterium]|nr:DUF3301 domain-containing protein [Gammaproteobacteria bacterium]